MIEITPYASCYTTPDELPQALAQYPEVYIDSSKGRFKHLRLSGGRHVRLKIDDFPASVKAKVQAAAIPEINEEMNFLPAGRIPIAMWDQIVEFFRLVSKKFKSDYEAQAFILWSKDRGYFIHVPKQEVSKASLRFTYDKPEGSITVVDAHSHNSMSAFYSGTDEANDKDNVCYSAVVGKLTATSYECVIRFNMYETKRKTTLSEVFESPEEQRPDVPDTWLTQIGEPARVHYGTYGSYGNTANFQSGRGNTGAPLSGKQNPSTTISRRANLEELLNDEGYEDWWNNRSGMAASSSQTYPVGQDLSDPDHNIVTDFDRFEAGMTPDNAIVLKDIEDMNGLEGLEEDPVGAPSNVAGRVYNQADMVAEEFAKLSRSQKDELRKSWADEGLDPDVIEAKLTGDTEGLSEAQEIAVEYGSAVGDAYEQITAYMDDVCDCDEVLRRIMSAAYDMLSEEGRIKLANEGIAGLD